jgi:hypothetical protein
MGYTPEVGADVFLISRKDTEGVGRINFNSKKIKILRGWSGWKVRRQDERGSKKRMSILA